MRLVLSALVCLISLSVFGQCIDPLACNYNSNEIDVGDGLFIPDDQSQCFSSEHTFTSFFPGSQVIDANADILNLFVNMEHSYMGDLIITFICPNGQSMMVHQQGGNGTYLGVPIDDEFLPDDPGIGYDYYWDPNATNGTWEANAGSTGGTLPAGAYESAQPFSNLNGCPLNGTWEIEVCDLWAVDNGFIFDWSIEFDSSLYDNSSCLYIGDSCDDNNTYTTNDTYNSNCECIGDEEVIYGCMDIDACNYSPYANSNIPGDCIFIGDPCNDSNPLTLNDVIDENCFCGGIEITRIDELEALSVLIYPNPASNNLTVDLGDLNGVNTTIKLYDPSSKLLFEKKSTSTLMIDVSGFAKGMYSIELSTDEQVLRSQVIIE